MWHHVVILSPGLSSYSLLRGRLGRLPFLRQGACLPCGSGGSALFGARHLHREDRHGRRSRNHAASRHHRQPLVESGVGRAHRLRRFTRRRLRLIQRFGDELGKGGAEREFFGHVVRKGPYSCPNALVTSKKTWKQAWNRLATAGWGYGRTGPETPRMGRF
jgi:hypothetical protein